MSKILVTEKVITNKISTKILISRRGLVLGYGANPAANLAYQVGVKTGCSRQNSNQRGQKKMARAVSWVGDKVDNAAQVTRRLVKPM